MKHANVVTYKETGHFVHIERAAEVNQEILHFMER
ncbi:hypothetical protein EMGBS15_16460 [Filimonas sp.]|nr:hypothetical protein EMGBS15_16460 [Filimonas sp.]